MAKIPDYTTFDSMLARAGSEFNAAEAHGMLCGALCMAGRQIPLQVWFNQLLPGDLSAANPVLQELEVKATDLLQHTLQQLDDELLTFRLILPEDDDTLQNRVAALAAWCQGFNYGLAINGYQETAADQSNVAELIRDFSEISRAGTESGGETASEEEESAFSELEEYVRIGVLLIMDEMQPAQPVSPSLH